MSTLKLNAVQIGQSVTATNNFTLFQPTVPDGTVRLGVGNADSVTDAVTLTSAGNVGIGTSSPTFKLDLVGGGASIFNSGGTANSTIRYGNTDKNWFVGLRGDTGDSFAIADDTTFRLTVTSDGNVGIGTSSPATRLHVAGATTATSQVTTQHTGSAVTTVFGCDGGIDVGAVYVTTNHPLAFRTNNTERMRIDSSGNLLVGTTSSNPVANSVDGVQFGDGRIRASKTDRTPLELQRRTTNGIIVEFRRDNTTPGSISVTTTNTTYSTSSDYRLKHDIAPMTGALARVAALKPCTYKWNADDSIDEGFIAHELQEICPSAVSGEKDAVNEDGSIKPQGVDTSFLVATLTAAIQEQQAIIESLKARLDAANI